jgi:hypothetical protein
VRTKLDIYVLLLQKRVVRTKLDIYVLLLQKRVVRTKLDIYVLLLQKRVVRTKLDLYSIIHYYYWADTSAGGLYHPHISLYFGTDVKFTILK